MKFTTLKVILKSYYSLGWESLLFFLRMNQAGKKVPNYFGFKWKEKETAQRVIRRITDLRLQGKVNAIAIKTGNASNLFLLDLDIGKEKNGLKKIKELKISIPDNTVCAETPSGGMHYYFTLPEELKDYTTGANLFEKNSGIDFRANGGLAFAPPSQVKGGGNYKWLITPFSTELKRPPDKFIEMLLHKNEAVQGTPKKQNLSVYNSSNGISEKQRSVLFDLLTESANTEEGYRSEIDFKFINFGIKIGYSKEELWNLCKDVSKFSTDGRKYFDRTYNNAC